MAAMLALLFTAALAAPNAAERVCNAGETCEALAQDAVLLQKKVVHRDDQRMASSADNYVRRGLVADEGSSVGDSVGTLEACKQACSSNGRCNSFTFQPVGGFCHLKDKVVTAGDPSSISPVAISGVYVTYYKQGHGGDEPHGAGGTVTVMSYNTEYKNYNARMAGYATKIRDVAPAIVGLQECQNRDGLAGLARYAAIHGTGKQDYMLYDSGKVTLVSSGWMRIPRDLYADRAITWAKFRLGSDEFYFFNTHLPHNHGEAADKRTHARIAASLLQKRRELGAENMPTIVVGDMNSFASDFGHVEGGGFESNLEANGFVNAYTAQGSPGYPGLDHILYSAAHWTHSDCRDRGTGGSDHTSITCELTLKK